ncbi:MAG: biopolymer transporter ExbD [Gammaproteobacteria bacterium]|nr:biopolymer transporter ExbD [Gammaproteobacteria bacterium]
MKLRTANARDEPELNVTSLIDVVLLLLIFFMLTTTFVRPSQIAIRLPEAGVSSDREVDRQELEISVTGKGEFRVNGRALIDSRPETLEAAIRQVIPEVRERHVTLSADGRASHQDVVTAMDVAGRLGFAEVRITTVRSRPPE